MRRAWPTLEVTAARPTVVLLTAVALGTNLVAAAVEAFADEGVPVFASSIPRREALKQAYGTAPSWPLYGYDDVLKEVLEVLA
ncbi:hypothetical protein MSM1_16565 [Mycobacterium sp. SM1]|uniref:hypothetical protein n=1 Tax=Mycobacterium sp. SM1 TaxID=2816243 RepID=UPI001BCC4738|nr:hypothetical protein [Mycobacterium sp. SM1]MBS4729888.1 hypothetical protein [Mycobacterium sp. SM1]